MSIKSIAKKPPYLYPLLKILRVYFSHGFLGMLLNVKLVARYLKDYRAYLKLNTNPAFDIGGHLFYPCIFDRTAVTPIEPTYFFQDSWAAGKISKNKPMSHVDVGSSIMTMAVISQFVRTTFVDIRPVELRLDGLEYKNGTILALPFSDGSLNSISSLCVVEHIGLGRYGDPIDPFGSEKAIKELKRVLASGGNLYFSLPVDTETRIYFNAHRAFTREYVFELFSDLRLVEEKYHYGTQLYDFYDPMKGFGTGLFHFTK